MRDIITSYLVQRRQVALPGIGELNITSKPAVSSTANNLIMPPEDKIIFSETDIHTPDELVKYIAKRKNINVDVAEDELKKMCADWKQKISAGEELCLETLGCLKNGEAGTIFFQDETSVQYMEPLPVHVNYKNEVYTLAADSSIRNINNITENYHATKIIESGYAWLQWAMILCAVALVALFFHYYDKRFTTASSGNQSHFFVASPDSTYFTPVP